MAPHPLNVPGLSEEELRQMRSRYHMLRSNVRRANTRNGRNIEFKLTLQEWADIWLASGHYADIGTHKDQYIMARRNVEGDYTPDNVEIVKISDNTSRIHRGLPKNHGRSFNVGITRSEETRRKQSLAHRGRTPVPTGTPIQTPQGVFGSIREAAEYYDVNVTAIHYFKRKYPLEWYYIL